MRRLKVRPALHNLPGRDSPDDDAAERKPLPVCESVAVQRFRTTTLSSSAITSSICTWQIGKSLQRAAHILNRSRRPGRHSWRHIRPVIHEVCGEVLIPDLHVFPVDKLLDRSGFG
jgi:hypothetical protein